MKKLLLRGVMGQDGAYLAEMSQAGEFLYSEDLADACVYLMNRRGDSFSRLLGGDETMGGKFELPLIDIGVGRTAKKSRNCQPDEERRETSRSLRGVLWLRVIESISPSEGLAAAYRDFLCLSRELQ